jgi:DNA-binding MurR/RpiR family transcriptional regulator
VKNLEKIFTTQLIGKLQKINEQEIDIEDGARLLAQALVGDGSIYIYAEDELAAVFNEAKYGQEPLSRVEQLTEENVSSLSTADRVLMISRSAQDEKLLGIARTLRQNQVPFVALSSKNAKEDNPIEDLAHAYIDLNLEKGLVPDDFGGRKGYPHLILALFVYHHMKLVMDELMADY